MKLRWPWQKKPTRVVVPGGCELVVHEENALVDCSLVLLDGATLTIKAPTHVGPTAIPKVMTYASRTVAGD